MWFQHDGAPAHFSADVRSALDTAYPGRWIGRDGPVNWPARSPDLSCLDFFLWGYVKSLVYASPIDSDEALVARIAVVAGEIQEMPGIFASVRHSLRRCCLCNEENRQIKMVLSCFADASDKIAKNGTTDAKRNILAGAQERGESLSQLFVLLNAPRSCCRSGFVKEPPNGKSIYQRKIPLFAKVFHRGFGEVHINGYAQVCFEHKGFG
ncbi:uncharacterized protein TNCV_1900501 [Trichonephila clavipes]|nr:uncharacterized protein TNCV_1900501 [Trichonephila clavipes]